MRTGKVTENVLKRSVWKNLNKGLDKDKKSAAGYTDCASFGIQDNVEQDTPASSVVSAVNPVTFPAAHAGRYAVAGAVNNILAGGGYPRQVLLSILLPADAQESTIRQIMADAGDTACSYGVSIGGGHTEVTDVVSYPLVTATAIGLKKKPPRRNKKLYAGNSIIVTKWIGLEGTAVIAEERESAIREKYPSFIADAGLEFGTMKYLSVADEAQIACERGATCLHDISGGGILSSLWELGEMTGCGMDIDMKAIPIRQETVEITDIFDINPYLLLSGGALLITAQDGKEMVAQLEAAGIPAAIIGTLNDTNDRIIHNEDETRFLDLPQADEIHKVIRSSFSKT